MYQMILFVLDEIEKSSEILDAWELVGVRGVTILDSTGLGRARKISYRDDIPLLPSLLDFVQERQEHHLTFFTVVENEALVDQVIAETERIMGNLSQPNKGALFVLPVSRAIGLATNDEQQGKP